MISPLKFEKTDFNNVSLRPKRFNLKDKNNYRLMAKYSFDQKENLVYEIRNNLEFNYQIFFLIEEIKIIEKCLKFYPYEKLDLLKNTIDKLIIDYSSQDDSNTKKLKFKIIKKLFYETRTYILSTKVKNEIKNYLYRDSNNLINKSQFNISKPSYYEKKIAKLNQNINLNVLGIFKRIRLTECIIK